MLNTTNVLLLGAKGDSPTAGDRKLSMQTGRKAAWSCAFPHGTLQRKSQHFGSWDQRFYILRSKMLLYWEQQPSNPDDIFSSPMGVVFLEGCTVSTQSTKDDPFCFVISNADKFQYFLRAKNLIDLNTWIAAIEASLHETEDSRRLISINTKAVASPQSPQAAEAAASAARKSGSPASSRTHSRTASLRTGGAAESETDRLLSLVAAQSAAAAAVGMDPRLSPVRGAGAGGSAFSSPAALLVPSAGAAAESLLSSSLRQHQDALSQPAATKESLHEELRKFKAEHNMVEARDTHRRVLDKLTRLKKHRKVLAKEAKSLAQTIKALEQSRELAVQSLAEHRARAAAANPDKARLLASVAVLRTRLMGTDLDVLTKKARGTGADRGEAASQPELIDLSNRLLEDIERDIALLRPGATAPSLHGSSSSGSGGSGGGAGSGLRTESKAGSGAGIASTSMELSVAPELVGLQTVFADVLQTDAQLRASLNTLHRGIFKLMQEKLRSI